MRFTIPFVVTAAASGVKTETSGAIEFDHVVEKIQVEGVGKHLVQVKPFTAANDDTPSSGEPSGANLIPSFAQSEYIVYDMERVVLHVNREAPRGHFVKIYISNTDTVEQTAYVLVTIRSKNVRDTN